MLESPKFTDIYARVEVPAEIFWEKIFNTEDLLKKIVDLAHEDFAFKETERYRIVLLIRKDVVVSLKKILESVAVPIISDHATEETLRRLLEEFDMSLEQRALPGFSRHQAVPAAA